MLQQLDSFWCYGVSKETEFKSLGSKHRRTFCFPSLVLLTLQTKELTLSVGSATSVMMSF